MNRFFYLVGKSFANIFSRPLSLMASFLSLLLLYFMLNLVWIGYLSGTNYFDSLISDLYMELYLDDELSEDEVDALYDIIITTNGVVNSQYVTKDLARERLFSLMGTDLLDGLEQNPLPRSIILEFGSAYLSTENLDRAVENIMAFDGVTEIYYPNNWLLKSEYSRSLIVNGAFFLGIAVALAIIFNLLHILRLSVRYFQDEIKQFLLLGAGKSFLSLPYIIEAIFYGFIVSVISWGMTYFLIDRVSFEDLRLILPKLYDIGIFCATSAVLGMIVGLVIVRRVIK